MHANSVKLNALSSSPAARIALASGVYAIVDGDALGWPAAPTEPELYDLVAQSAAYALAAVQAGAVAVQLRYKVASASARQACAMAVVRALAGRVPAVVNDDMAVALQVGAGLHWGSPTATRAWLGGCSAIAR